MSEEDMSRYIVYGLDGDPGTPCLATCQNSVDMGPYVLSVVGEGNPYFAFESLPAAILTADEIGANFNTGALASADYQANRLAVASLYASPPPVGESDDGTNVVWKAA